MKKIYQIIVLLGLSQMALAQYDVQNVYVAAGGSYSNPDDFVEIKKIAPETYSAELFNTIYTQAVTDLLIYGDRMFVAAMDSLVAYDLTTGQRYAAIAVSNTNKLSMVDNSLWLSRQEGVDGPPADAIFLKVFHPDDLSLVKDIQGINADAAYVNYGSDSIYVTVPGNWSSTTGSIAVLDKDTYTVHRVVDLGADAVGIFNIYNKGDMLWICCRTPYMGANGSFVAWDPANGSYEILTQEAVFGFGAGIDVANDRVFLLYDNTIAAYSFSNASINTIAPDPGSANWISYASAAYERGSETIWANFTDYYSFGTCKLYNMSGEELGSADVGISPDAMAFHYDGATGMAEKATTLKLSLFPNPATTNVVVASNEPALISVFNANGTLMTHFHSNGIATINVSDFATGLYFVKAENKTMTTVNKLMVQ